MKWVLGLVLFCCVREAFSQSAEYEQKSFCKNLNKVFEYARANELASYGTKMVKQSAFLTVPGNPVKLERFALNYVDKDERFVAKTNLNLDSLSALQTLEEFRSFIGYCLDSTWNKWEELSGNDTSTVFFKEFKQIRAKDKDISLSLAITIVAPRIYSINMYITRRK